MTDNIMKNYAKDFAKIENERMKLNSRLSDEKSSIYNSSNITSGSAFGNACMCYGLNLIDPDEMN